LLDAAILTKAELLPALAQGNLGTNKLTTGIG
jgi:hypothetical protein